MKTKAADYFSKHQGSILKYLLGAIMLLFIGILITVYFVAKQANPIFLDEKGRPINSQAADPRY